MEILAPGKTIDPHYLDDDALEQAKAHSDIGYPAAGRRPATRFSAHCGDTRASRARFVRIGR